MSERIVTRVGKAASADATHEHISELCTQGAIQYTARKPSKGSKPATSGECRRATAPERATSKPSRPQASQLMLRRSLTIPTRCRLAVALMSGAARTPRLRGGGVRLPPVDAVEQL